MTAISWISGDGGLWTDSADWSSGTVPGPADNVTIAIAPEAGLTSYTIEINTVVDVNSLTLDQEAAILQVGDGSGDGTLSTQLYLDAGTLELVSGTLTGTVTQTGGAIEVGSQDFAGEGTFQNLTWQGDFQPIFSTGDFGDASELLVQGGLTLTGIAGTGPGTMTLEQAGSIEFLGQQTLDNAAVYLGGAGYDPTALGTEADNGTAGTLTLGPNLLLEAVGYSQISGGLIVNDGTISATGTALLLVSSGTLANVGQLTVDSGAQVDFNGASLINDGTVTVASGGTLVLTLSEGGTWQNDGALLDNGLIVLDGILTAASLAALPITEGANGALQLGGTLVNTGTDLVLGSGGVAPNLVLGGIIEGGTITGASNLLFAPGVYGELDGVTVVGGISLTGLSEQFTIANGIQFNKGGLIVTGNNDAVSFTGATVLSNVVVQMGSVAGDTLTAAGGAELTIGATTQVEVRGASATLDASGTGSGAGTVLNQGSITASGGAFLTLGNGSTAAVLQDYFDNQGKIDVSGNSILYIATPNLVNTGTIELTDSTLLLGQATAAELSAFKLVDSTTAVAGTLTATGATLNFSPLEKLTIGVAAPGTQSNASVVGGTLHDTDGGIQLLGTVSLTGLTYQGLLTIGAPSSNVTLTDVALQNVSGTAPGRLVLSGNGAQLEIAGTTTIGTLDMTGARVSVTIAAGTTLDNATVDFGSKGGSTIQGYQESGDPPALGANLVIDQTGEYATIAGNFFVSDATISAAYAGGFMTLYGAPFVNDGSITVGASETVTSAANEFINGGTVSVSGGGTLLLTLGSYYGNPPASGTSFANAGLIAVSGGTIREISGPGVPPVPMLNQSTGLITGSGMIVSEVANDGTISAANGALTLTEAVSGQGTLQISGDATLSLLTSVAAREVAQFGGADGVLGLAPKLFLGEIGGFAAGDTIDLLKTPATAASFSGSSIEVTLTTESTISLHTTSALSGALTVTSDGNGGSLIGFAGTVHFAADVSEQAWAYAQAPETGFVRAPDLTSALDNAWDAMIHHGVV